MSGMPAIKDFKPKKFWERPEGTTGMLLGAAAIVGVVWFIWATSILVIIQTILSSLLNIIITGVACAALLWVLFDPKFRNLIFYMYKSVCRKITGFFVQIDPIGIIQTYIEKAEKHIQNVRHQIKKVRGGLEDLKREMASNANKMQENLNLVKAAKESGNSKYIRNARLAARQTGRLDKSQKTYKDLYVKMEGLYKNLCRVEEAADFFIQDTKDEVKVRKKERDIITKGHSAMKSAMKLLKPEDDEVYMFDLAMEFMAEDVANKVGDMEHYLEITDSFLNGVDLKNATFEEEGFAILDNFEKEGSALLGSEKQALISEAKDDKFTLDLDHPNVQRDPKTYMDIGFKKYFKN